MFAFYDFETTGTSPAFDQPIQFAAILTDDDLNQIERVNIRCRLSPHILPSPWAMVVTGVTSDQLTDPSIPSWFEFTQQLREIVQRWAPATWTGYNSLGFDEEFLRQSFYQCLQPNLYETQWNGNDRLDILRVVYSAWELAPDILEWPLDDKGRNTFKLDRLAPANGFEHHDAHDALGDVEATIHIARLVRDRAPEVWQQCLRNRSKNDVNDLLQTGQPLRLVERFGARPPRSYFGCFCGRNPDNPNSIGFYDLDGGDPADLISASDDAVMAAVSATPKLIRSVAVNKVPSLFVMTPSDPVHDERAALIASRQDFQVRVGQALAGRFADAELPEHVEQQVYSGFYGAPDRQRLEQWQDLDWSNRYQSVGSFDDVRLRQLARRLVYLEHPELLPGPVCESLHDQVQKRWATVDKVPWTTFQDVDNQLSEISSAGGVDAGHMAELVSFYGTRRRVSVSTSRKTSEK